MTLDGWMALVPHERNRYRADWRLKDEYWLELLKEACNRFKRQYGGIDGINAVHHVLGPNEPGILVVIARHSPQILEELPDRYLTFRVSQEQAEDTKDYYLNAWSIVLRELLQWTYEQTQQWASQHHYEGLNGIDRFFTHEEPIFYITDLLVPEDIRHTLTNTQMIELHDALRLAVSSFHLSPSMDSHYDWNAARRRVRDVLSTLKN